MFKKLLIGVALTTAALTSTQLLADPAGHRHGQNTPCTGEKCPAATAEQHGQHGIGHGGMQGGKRGMHAARGEHQGKGAHGARHGNKGEGCPMHSGAGERKPA